MNVDKLNVLGKVPTPAMMRFGSLFSLIVGVAFLLISLFLNAYRIRESTVFEVMILFGLVVTVTIATFALSNLRSQQRRAEQAFQDTDSEFSSIFHNVLDGVLIVDDAGKCLDANPGAAAILRLDRDALIGENISRFLMNGKSFTSNWTRLLDSNKKRGHAELIAGDGATVFVDFTAATNYLPGRHVVIICDVTERTHAEQSLRNSEERFQCMANNIHEIFWMMHANSQEVIYVNPAYAAITGESLESIQSNPLSYRELIHPEDRIRFLSKLRDVAEVGTLDEEFRFIRADGEIRWAWVKGARVPSQQCDSWIVGTAQDITSRKKAETKIIEQLETVEAARAEAEALRKSTLALSQNLAMDSVLDTLLQCIGELVPFDRATVLFVEENADLMVARELPGNSSKRIGLTFRASQNVFLQRVLFERRAILLQNVARESEWRDVQSLDHPYSWLGIPLCAADQTLGVMSLSTCSPRSFTPEHLRLAKSLAIPAAVAIQNARTHERAEIYAAELQTRLSELGPARNAQTNCTAPSGHAEAGQNSRTV
jgi:PAS domain S-box-containing protein